MKIIDTTMQLRFVEIYHSGWCNLYVESVLLTYTHNFNLSFNLLQVLCRVGKKEAGVPYLVGTCIVFVKDGNFSRSGSSSGDRISFGCGNDNSDISLLCCKTKEQGLGRLGAI